MYPWETKQKLNKLNQKLIKQNIGNSIYLTVWGHQQVILPDENTFDTEVMREMGVEYLISTKAITQTNNSKILFLKNFHLYKIMPTQYIYINYYGK